MNKIRVCIIGLGRFGMLLENDKKRLKPATHFGLWSNSKKVSLVGVSDNDLSKEKIVKKKYPKIKFYTNYKKMLHECRPDIISIVTWKDTHFSITKYASEFGVKVIVLEKPLANNQKQGKKLLSIIKKNKTHLIVNHRRRFDEKIIKLKKQIERNDYGLAQQVTVSYVYGILATGTHVIDTLRMLFAKNYGDINEVIGIKDNNQSFCSSDDINLNGILFFKSGLICYIQVLNIKKYDIFDFDLFFSKNKIKISGIGRNIYKYKIIKSDEHENFTELDYENVMRKAGPKPRNQFKLLEKNAINCLLGKEKPMSSGIDSYKALVIIDALIRSANKKSQKIKVKY
jgi:predicted dehydrogenase